VDVVVIGAGVVGCAVARWAALFGREVVVLERGEGGLDGQSARNSGVMHAGHYYDEQTRPLKARLCARGNGLLREFCLAHGVAHARCGKLMVAVDAADEAALAMYLARARANGVTARLIDGGQAREMEPGIVARRALWLPDSGVVEPTSLARALEADAVAAGAVVARGAEVAGARAARGGFVLDARRAGGEMEPLAAGWVVNCAGLWADDVARLIDPACRERIDPMRGEAAWFRRGARPGLDVARMNVYPTPRRVRLPGGEYWTVGVHLTPTLVPAGPEGGAARLSEVVSVGPLNFAARGKGDLAGEHRPMEEFRAQVAGYFPQLRAADLRPYQVGVQARLAGRQDWHVAADPNHRRWINLLGIDSPGLTSCLALAEHVGVMLAA